MTMKMTTMTMIKKAKPDLTCRTVHLYIVFFGLAAWLTGDGADDYKKADYFDYTLHKWIGMALAAGLLFRVIYGLAGPRGLRFSRWLPYTKERLKLAGGVLVSAAQYRAPDRTSHLAFAGLIQGAGIILFAWMAVTGSVIFFFLEPGRRAGGFMHFIMEIHEAGEELIPVFLTVHVGSVIIHALYGLDIWRNMFFMKKRK